MSMFKQMGVVMVSEDFFFNSVLEDEVHFPTKNTRTF